MKQNVNPQPINRSDVKVGDTIVIQREVEITGIRETELGGVPAHVAEINGNESLALTDKESLTLKRREIDTKNAKVVSWKVRDEKGLVTEHFAVRRYDEDDEWTSDDGDVYRGFKPLERDILDDCFEGGEYVEDSFRVVYPFAMGGYARGGYVSAIKAPTMVLNSKPNVTLDPAYQRILDAFNSSRSVMVR